MSLVQKDQTLVYKFKIKIKLKATYSNMDQRRTTADTTNRQRRPGAIPHPGRRGPRSRMIHSPSTFLVDTAVEELFAEEILLNDSTNRQRRAGAIAPPSSLLVDTLFAEEIMLNNTTNRQRRPGAIAPPSTLLVDTVAAEELLMNDVSQLQRDPAPRTQPDDGSCTL